MGDPLFLDEFIILRIRIRSQFSFESIVYLKYVSLILGILTPCPGISYIVKPDPGLLLDPNYTYWHCMSSSSNR